MEVDGNGNLMLVKTVGRHAGVTVKGKRGIVKNFHFYYLKDSFRSKIKSSIDTLKYIWL